GRGRASRSRDGHVLREPGARRRVRDPACRGARAEGVSGSGRDRQGDRAAEARDDGCRDRPADGGAGEVPRLVGRGHLDPERIVRFEEDGPKGVLLDQRRLPDEEVELECRSVADVVDAIRSLAIRGAPAIGVAAAYGLALAAERGEDVEAAASALAAARPTAVN